MSPGDGFASNASDSEVLTGFRARVREGLLAQGYAPPPVFGAKPPPPGQYCYLRNPPPTTLPASQHAAHTQEPDPWSPSTPSELRKARATSYKVRAGLRRPYRLQGGEQVFPQQRRIGACGYSVVAPSGHVALVAGPDGRVSWKGLAQCGNVHACPVCRLKIQAGRAVEVTEAVEAHGVRRVVMLTLTIRHGAGDDLRTMRAKLSDAYRGMTRGAAWARFKARHGIVGSIRATEVKHGPINGWHPHLHILLFLGHDVDAAKVIKVDGVVRWIPAEVGWVIDRWRVMVGRYLDGLGGLQVRELDGEAVLSGAQRFRRPDAAHLWADRNGYGPGSYVVAPWGDELDGEHVPSEEHGAVMTPAKRGSYLTKLGLEMTDVGATKRSWTESRSPMEIACDYTTTRSRQDGKLWRNYAAAMHGSRALEWTRGLKARFGIRDRDDLHVMQDEEPCGGQVVIIAQIPADVWSIIRETWTRDRVPAAYDLIRIAEERGAEGLESEIRDLLKHQEKRKGTKPP